MSNYRHAYHAGNFADVFKHTILCLLLEKLGQKETPYCVLETHAGSGYYDLRGVAQKTKEFEAGVSLVMQANPVPKLMLPYHQVIQQYNTHSKAGFPVYHYPGSPLITAYHLREADRLLACEAHSETFQTLRATLRTHRNVKCFHTDGYQWLNAQLPPLEKRGIVVIDPPFENPNEFKSILSALKQCYRKFAHGIYAIWYPIKTRYPIKQFHNALRATGIEHILAVELCLHPLSDPSRLNGCGMVIINPPWKLDKKLQECVPQIHRVLGKKSVGKTTVNFLVP